MHEISLSKITLFFFLFNTLFLTAQVSVGEGSYSSTFPGTDAAGRNGFPSGSPQLSGNAAGKPVPTNDWWSRLIKENHADNLFNYPMTLKTTNQGLIVTYIPWGPIGDSSPIEVGVSGLNAIRSTASDYSDWTVTMNWNDNTHELKATSGIGMPFIYFEKDSDDLVEIKVNSGAVTVDGELLIIKDASHGADFVFYGPSGSTWSSSGSTYTSELNGKNYWSMAMLPQNTNNVNDIALEYQKYAYVFPVNTSTSWNYEESSSKLVTTFQVATEVKEGSESKVLLGLLPHQWNNLSAGSVSPEEYSYETVRGELKTLNGNSFTVENTFKGILPTLPNLVHFSPEYSPADLNSKISQIENDALATWTDSYNEGQVMNRLIQTARIADQIGNTEARDKMIATIKERLEDWLSYQSGEVAFLFYYNDSWSSMLGYPAGHGQDNNLNDHHFHWGYFIHAAAFMEQYEPGWAEKWGDMIRLLIRDAASDNRSDSMFPFLRNFSPYAGHSWANGFATFPQGNDQESTSESMQFASSLIHWGTITEDDAIRDLGIYIYTTEQTAIEEYWFDMYKRNFGPTQPYSLVSRVWGNSYDNGTFWTSDIAASYGIEMYPIHGGSLYLGHNQDYASSLWTEITANTGILQNEENPNLWHDTYWKYLSLIDPQSALDLYESYPERTLKFGISDAQTYHWLHAMKAMGTVDPSITANYPIAVAFKENGEATYAAHNYSDSDITVSFSDGFKLQVPANSMATNRDLNVSGVLTADSYQVEENESVKLMVSVEGSGITKVEFYNDDIVLGEDLSAPYELSLPNLELGIYTVFAKVYVGSDFNVTNVVTIQVGSQVPYLGAPHAVPGTIEAGHYDTFEGGTGQNITYFDSSVENQGGFRPEEYVDAAADVNEGATLGWITAGEWLEYTIDVEKTGCYDLNMRYASGNNGGGGPFYFEVDGEKVSPDILMSTTGDWGNWNGKVSSINLTEGVHILRLAVGNGEFNLGKMTFTYNSEICVPVEIGLPFDFESSPVTSDFNNFNGGTATVEPVTAPQDQNNNSTNLAKIVRDGGDIWAGAFLNLQGGLDFSSAKYLTLKLWTEAPVGTTVRMKLEQQTNPGSFAELDVLTKESGEWETLSWDFSNLGATLYDRIVFMFDFGNTGDGTSSSTFYFDDVDQVATLSAKEFPKGSIHIYPNPVSSNIYLRTSGIRDLTKVEIYSILGQKVLEQKSDLRVVNVEGLIDGIYFLKAYNGKSYATIKIIKE